jgi:hypothetical protein
MFDGAASSALQRLSSGAASGTVFVDDEVDSSLLILNKQVGVVQKFMQAIALMTCEGLKVPSKSEYFFRSATQAEHTKHRGKEVER